MDEISIFEQLTNKTGLPLMKDKDKDEKRKDKLINERLNTFVGAFPDLAASLRQSDKK